MLLIFISRSCVPVSELPKLQDQAHSNTEVEVNVTVEDEVARVVQLSSEDHIAAGRDLNDIFRKTVTCVGVVQFIISLLLLDELSSNTLIIFASPHNPEPAAMLVDGMSSSTRVIVHQEDLSPERAAEGKLKDVLTNVSFVGLLVLICKGI